MTARLPSIRVRELPRALERDGWYVARTTRHIILRHPDKPGLFPYRIILGKRLIKARSALYLPWQDSLQNDFERYSKNGGSHALHRCPGSDRHGRLRRLCTRDSGCVTQGDTEEEALAMAHDAAAALLADRAEHDEWIATENPGAIVASIEVPVPSPAAVGA